MDDIKIISGELADYKFGNDGILCSYQKNKGYTFENVNENYLLVKEITNNKKVPLLMHVSLTPIIDKDIIKIIIEQNPLYYTSIAIVCKTRFTMFVSNIIYKMNKSPIPMKAFINDNKACKWLKQYRKL